MPRPRRRYRRWSVFSGEMHCLDKMTSILSRRGATARGPRATTPFNPHTPKPPSAQLSSAPQTYPQHTVTHHHAARHRHADSLRHFCKPHCRRWNLVHLAQRQVVALSVRVYPKIKIGGSFADAPPTHQAGTCSRRDNNFLTTTITNGPRDQFYGRDQRHERCLWKMTLDLSIWPTSRVRQPRMSANCATTRLDLQRH